MGLSSIIWLNILFLNFQWLGIRFQWERFFLFFFLFFIYSLNLFLDSFLMSSSWMCIFSVISANFSIVSSLVGLDDDCYFEVLSFQDFILAFLTQSFRRLYLLATLTSSLKVVFSTWWIGLTFFDICCSSISIIRCLLSNSFLRKIISLAGTSHPKTNAF